MGKVNVRRTREGRRETSDKGQGLGGGEGRYGSIILYVTREGAKGAEIREKKFKGDSGREDWNGGERLGRRVSQGVIDWVN